LTALSVLLSPIVRPEATEGYNDLQNAPSLRSLVFGSESDRLASASVGPVSVAPNGEPPAE
jgi:hypothetical protein